MLGEIYSTSGIYYASCPNNACVPVFLTLFFSDVLELHNWHVEKLEAHPLFAPIPTEELEVLLNVLGPIPPEAEHSSAVEDTDVSHRYLGVSEVEFDGSEKATTADALALRAILAQTEESKKVGRLGGKKYFAVYRRLSDDECLGPSLSSEGSNTHGLPALFAPPATSAWQELWN